MTESRLIRPRFLRGSLIALLILLPFVAHSFWDYVEARRLTAALNAIQARGESLFQEFHAPEGDAAEADRYYRAGSALASGFRPEPQGWFRRVIAAERAEELPRDVADQLRSAVNDYREALSFIDRAAPLPFEAIAPGYSYNYLWLSTALRLAGLRALIRTIDGDGNGAVDSLYSEVRTARVMQGPPLIPSAWMVSDVKRVVAGSRPSAESLERLGQALAELDRDDSLSLHLQSLRTQLYQGSPARNPIGPQSWPAILTRPWAVHELNRGLDAFSAMLEAAEAPWPSRIDNIIAVGRWPVPVASGLGLRRDDPKQVELFVLSTVRRIVHLRSARVVVAIERYRRDHGEQMPATLDALVPTHLSAPVIDPFTGQTMLLKAEGHGYAVYSVGSNRRDDGGDFHDMFLPTESPDTGIRIQWTP